VRRRRLFLYSFPNREAVSKLVKNGASLLTPPQRFLHKGIRIMARHRTIARSLVALALLGVMAQGLLAADKDGQRDPDQSGCKKEDPLRQNGRRQEGVHDERGNQVHRSEREASATME
jgi:hypothetical protein